MPHRYASAQHPVPATTVCRLPRCHKTCFMFPGSNRHCDAGAEWCYGCTMRVNNLRLPRRLTAIGSGLLVVVIVMAACSNQLGRIETEQHLGYYVQPPADTFTFDFDRYVQFARDEVRARNPAAHLGHASRVASCNSIESTENLKMAFRFAGIGLYFLAPHGVMYQVWLQPSAEGGTKATVNVEIGLPATELEDKTDIAENLGVDFNAALRLARESGGAAFEQSHDPCEFVVILTKGQWLFTYRGDPTSWEKDILQICVDSETGEACAEPPGWWLNQE